MKYPELLIFLIPLGLLYFFLKNRSTTIGIHPKLIISTSASKERLLLLVAALLLLALARPQIELEHASKEPINPLFVAIDLSNSMQARDVKPNRLAKALSLAEKLIGSVHRKTALIIFTQNPLLIAPPTSDKEMLRRALHSIEPKNILTKGTNFQKLLDFVHSFEGKKDLVIFSDGGEFTDLRTYNDITIYAVALGSDKGALIPTDDGYLKQDGKLVVSRINPHFLRIAKEYSINELKRFDFRSPTEKTKEHSYLELFFIPVSIAFLLLLHIYTTTFEKLKKLIPLLLIVQLHASVIQEYKLQKGYDLYAHKAYEEALSYFDTSTLQGIYAKARVLEKLGKPNEAIKLYQSIKTTDRALKARLFFDIGRCYETMRKYDAAREAYIHSMQLRPSQKTLAKIEDLAFKHDEKKQLLPFTKQKVTKNRSKTKSKNNKTKKSASKLASSGGANKGSQKRRSKSPSSSKSLPLGSKVYELINKGYIDEKNPW